MSEYLIHYIEDTEGKQIYWVCLDFNGKWQRLESIGSLDQCGCLPVVGGGKVCVLVRKRERTRKNIF